MKDLLLAIAIIFLFAACADDNVGLEDGIPSGMRGTINGLYWQADSVKAFMMDGRSATNPSIRTVMQISGYRWAANNQMDMMRITLHDDRIGEYNTDDKNFFAELELVNENGAKTRYIAYPGTGTGEGEIFHIKDDVIDGHFQFLAVGSEPPQRLDSISVFGGNFKMFIEDITSN